ncbi:MAG: prenyltransferase/squalene oxidase repeat-containing protein [Phycisphaerae bacterium]
MTRQSVKLKRPATAASAAAGWVLALGLATYLGLGQGSAPAHAAAPEPGETTAGVLGVDARTQRVIDGALRFLADRQTESGAWNGQGDKHRAAITAYVLNTFLATGNLPNEGEYGEVVARGLDYLLNECVRPDGYIANPTGESNMYGHGIATIVLGEVYGQTADERIRPKLESAIRLIIETQNGEGGWRYQPRRADADVSVTVLQVVALRVAKNSGIDVPQETIDRAVAYVKSCQDENSGGFNYQPRRKDPGFARTAAAIYSLQVCGLYDDPMIAAGSEYLVKNYKNDRKWFTYGSFYAAPAKYMIGGDTWRDWYAMAAGELLEKVEERDGGQFFWKPIDGGRGVNDIYATAVYTTVLALPLQYLPIYQR